MKEIITGCKFSRRVREDVPQGSSVDRIFSCPQDDLDIVLKNWEKIRENYKKIGIDVFQYFLSERPFYKDLFSSLVNLTFDELEENEDFQIHAYAIIKGLDSFMSNLSAKYEEDNQILPFISYTHKSRGITQKMMTHLKEALLFICGTFLQSNKREKAAWKTVVDFIFNYYLLKDLPPDEEGKENENSSNKIFRAMESDCQNTTLEFNEINKMQEKKGLEEINSQVISSVNLLRKQSASTKPTSPIFTERKPSKSLLHPDHAKFMIQRRSSLLTPPLQRYALSLDDGSRAIPNGAFITSPLSSSAASSITSISNGAALGSNVSDPIRDYESRRSSTMTNKYSLLDALDLEYVLMKAAARGSIGPYSLSQSLQKLTFTQSLAFPALARGISKKKNSSQGNTRGTLDPLEPGVNTFAKVATVLILMLISVLVFGILYKFIRT